jgi:hypothetical protein
MARRTIARKAPVMKHAGAAETAAPALLERNLPALSRSMTFSGREVGSPLRSNHEEE